MPKLFAVIDGHSLMHRAFYALPPMNAPSGEFTNAVFGFLNMFLKAVGSLSPSHVLVVFDRHEPTFRAKEYADYKAHRKPMPDDLRSQFPLLQDALKAMGVSVYDKAGLEADDLLGIFSKRAEDMGLASCLISGDRDILQLVSDKVSVMLTKRGVQETVMYDPAKITEEYDLNPIQLIDVKALMGDASDNIPGVPGIGEKGALSLIRKYGSLERVLEDTDSIKGKLGERIRDNVELARLSKLLATILRDADGIDCAVDDCAFDSSAMGGARDMFAALGFRSLLARLPKGGETQALAHAGPIEEKQWRKVECNSLEAFSAAIGDIGDSFALESDGHGLTLAYGDTLALAPFGGTLLEPGIMPEDAFGALKALLESDAHKALYDAKRWKHYLIKQGIELKPPVSDVMLQAYLLRANETLTLESLVQGRFGADSTPDAARVMELSNAQQGELEEKGLVKLLDEIEAPLTEVLFEMERTGFLVDRKVLSELGGQFKARLDELEAEIYLHAGEQFNILSPKQLGVVLFETLGLPSMKKTKTGYSTDQETLESLLPLHPIAAPLLEYRKLSKLNSTYIDGLIGCIASDGRVHSVFQQTVTATGRISSTEPNLQNIPIRTEQGREIRRAFVAREGCALVCADYSQIELRVLAHMSGDEAMIRAFIEGGDIHAKTAAEVFGVAQDMVTPDQRGAAKAVNFGIVYGISDFGLARNLGIPRKQAADYIERYFATYPGIKRYMDDAVERAKSLGYAETLLGRRRAMPELKSSNRNVRNFGERVAMNMPIQGTAADIIKVAMVKAHELLQGLEARLILQVHDELVIEAPDAEIERVVGILREAMEGAMELRVPLTAKCEIGCDWLYLEPVKG